MQAGALRRRVDIQQLTAGQDAIGQPVQTWSLLATVWASVTVENGASAIKADADVSMVKAAIRIRKRPDVTAAMRVLQGANIWQIRAVLPDEAKAEFLDLVCERVL